MSGCASLKVNSLVVWLVARRVKREGGSTVGQEGQLIPLSDKLQQIGCVLAALRMEGLY